jgi:hypothetical protein
MVWKAPLSLGVRTFLLINYKFAGIGKFQASGIDQ